MRKVRCPGFPCREEGGEDAVLGVLAKMVDALACLASAGGARRSLMPKLAS